MKGFFISVFIVLLLLPFSASATTYYVSRVDGSDSYNGRYPTYQGGSDGPWLTITKSVSSVSSGDTVYLRAGTWNEGLYIFYKSYTSKTTWARYPSDPIGSVILNGTGIEHEEHEDGVILIHGTSHVRIDGIKVINGYKAGINAVGGQYIEILNCITDTTYLSGIAFWIVTHGTIQGNTIYNSNMPNGYDEIISIASSSTDIDVSYNTLYAGNRNFGAMGGEGLNIKDGCSYVYVHHNYVDMSRPDGQESDRYSMGVDGWTHETHHIYFYKNIVKGGSWGLQCNSEEGGYAHHIYFYNNIVSHIGHGSMHGGGIGFPPYGNSPGLNEYVYWWNNIVYDCYYGARFYKEEIGAPIEVRNNIIYGSAQQDIRFDSGVPQQEVTLDHNLLSTTNPKFVNASGGNFHLMPDSPAIDNGTTISNVTDDFDGIARPQGVAYDMGAYEYVSVSGPKTYYVDSDIGNDANNCSQALNPSTPKRTVNSIMSCNPGPGETVRFRGNFSQTIFPSRSGEVLYAFQPIQGVSGSTVTFNTSISGLDSDTDYVTVYNSRIGNSGAFKVVSFSGTTVTVDTSDLPLGSFITETSGLYAAILRPVHFTAWDRDNVPVFNTLYQCYHVINQNVLMVSYLKSIGGDSVNGQGYEVWPAFEIDGSDDGNSDYLIFDHLEIVNAAGAISTESGYFHSNYDILQHNNIHDVGSVYGPALSELVYWGHWGETDYHHDYCQFMYNTIGPSQPNCTGTSGIDMKQSAHYMTIFGNEFVDLNTQAWGETGIHVEGEDVYILNNYFHNFHPDTHMSCAIQCSSWVYDVIGAHRVLIANNIFYNIAGCALEIDDASDIEILNNAFYHITSDPHSEQGDPDEWWAAVLLHNWQADLTGIVIRNNIVQDTHIGIGRYTGSNNNYEIDIDSDYNICYDCTYPFRGTITQNTHDLLVDPKFVNPGNDNFHLQSDSPAIDNGTALSDVAIDFDSVSRPQGAGYDIGAYEYVSGSVIPGDLDDDGDVDIDDLIIVTRDFGKTSGYDARADTILSGEIDIYDVVFVASRFS